MTDVVGGHIVIWRAERFSKSSLAMFERMQKTSSLHPSPPCLRLEWIRPTEVLGMY